MSLIVQKYGGTSVGSIERIEAVADNILSCLNQGHQVVTVVSAMGQETDRLKRLALSLCATPPSRELDMLLTAGERVSMALLSIALHKRGVGSISLTGSQSGILTDSTHGNARTTAILGDRVRQALDKRNVAIVAGFQGMSPASKDVTTLGRGGSDLTAVALAHVLKASGCHIYTDVAGVCTADPRIVKNARVISSLTWDELTELSWSGAGVMHPRAAHLAAKFQVALEIRSSFDFSLAGTKVKGNKKMEDAKVTGLTYRKPMNIVQVNVAKQNSQPSLLGAALTWLWQRGETPAIAQSRNHANSVEALLFALSSEHSEALVTWFYETCGATNHDVRDSNILKGLASLTIVGQGFWHQPEKVAEIVSLVGVQPELLETRNTALTFCLKEQELAPILTRLHEQVVDKN